MKTEIETKAIMYRRWSKITRKAVEKGLLVK